IVITHDHQPTVLIYVHMPLGVQMTIVVLDIRFQHPYPAQFIAHMLGVNVIPWQQLFIADMRRVNTIGVGRNEPFMVPYDFPVITLTGAVENTHLVHRDRSARARKLHVETVLRRLTNPTCARIIAPALTRLLGVVKELHPSIDLTTITLWQQCLVLVIGRSPL